MSKSGVEVIKGGKHTDERGELLFNNSFDLTPVKRFYIIKHPDSEVVRAWQGHQIEHKYFLCIKGTFLVAWKKIDAHNNPVNDDSAEYIILKASDSIVLSVPPGYANGLKAIESDSEIMVLSNQKLEDCADDQFSFDYRLWFNWDRF